MEKKKKKNFYTILLVRANDGFFSSGWTWVLFGAYSNNFEEALKEAKEFNPGFDYKSHTSCEH